MAIKKQPDSVPGKIPEAADEWLRLFLKHLEIHLVQNAQRLNAESLLRDLSLETLRAVKLTLLDSGLTAEQLTELLGRVAFEEAGATETKQWNDQLNARRFALIDQEIRIDDLRLSFADRSSSWARGLCAMNRIVRGFETRSLFVASTV